MERFDWSDSVLQQKANQRHPLTLVVRLCGLLHSVASEATAQGPEASYEAVIGITEAVGKLDKAGDLDAVGGLLQAVEVMAAR